MKLVIFCMTPWKYSCSAADISSLAKLGLFIQFINILI